LTNLYLELNAKIKVLVIIDREFYQDKFNWVFIKSYFIFG